MTDHRAVLLGELAEHAYQYRPNDPFTLASGERSAEYFDCKLALSRPRAMAALGPLVLGRLNSRIVAIGGLTMGSDPIAMSTCQASAETKHQVRWFSVRKDPKAHGQRKLIEGDVRKGDCVAVVDDVVTSGKSTIQAIEACRAFGLYVVQVIVLVDREQLDGLQNIQRVAGSAVPLEAIFRKSEIKAEWQRTHRIPETSPKTASESFVNASGSD